MFRKLLVLVFGFLWAGFGAVSATTLEIQSLEGEIKAHQAKIATLQTELPTLCQKVSFGGACLQESALRDEISKREATLELARPATKTLTDAIKTHTDQITTANQTLATLEAAAAEAQTNYNKQCVTTSIPIVSATGTSTNSTATKSPICNGLKAQRDLAEQEVSKQKQAIVALENNTEYVQNKRSLELRLKNQTAEEVQRDKFRTALEKLVAAKNKSIESIRGLQDRINTAIDKIESLKAELQTALSCGAATVPDPAACTDVNNITVPNKCATGESLKADGACVALPTAPAPLPAAAATPGQPSATSSAGGTATATATSVVTPPPPSNIKRDESTQDYATDSAEINTALDACTGTNTEKYKCLNTACNAFRDLKRETCMRVAETRAREIAATDEAIKEVKKAEQALSDIRAEAGNCYRDKAIASGRTVDPKQGYIPPIEEGSDEDKKFTEECAAQYDGKIADAETALAEMKEKHKEAYAAYSSTQTLAESASVLRDDRVLQEGVRGLMTQTSFFDTKNLSVGNEAWLRLGGGSDDQDNVLARIINVMARLFGTVAVLMFVIGAFFMITSQGDENQLQKGKTIALHTIIGLLLGFTAYIIVQFVISILFQT